MSKQKLTFLLLLVMLLATVLSGSLLGAVAPVDRAASPGAHVRPLTIANLTPTPDNSRPICPGSGGGSC